MFELVQAGELLMLPIILCSIMSFTICVQRFWTLRTSRVVPRNLLSKVWNAIRSSLQAFVIAADANKSHQLVATDMDAAEQIGFNKLSIPTKNVVEN